MPRFVQCRHNVTGATARLAEGALKHLDGWEPIEDLPPAPPTDNVVDLEVVDEDSPDLGDDTPENEEADR